MNKRIVSIFAALVCGSTLSASLINFQSGSLTSFLQADGATNLDGTYTFALGTFSEAALAGSSDSWFAAFDDQMVGTNDWLTSGPAPVINTFQGDQLMVDGSETSSAAYIFGYNTDQSEIIIFRNASWVFPTFDDLDVSADIFSLQDANTEVVTSAGSWVTFNNNLQMITASAVPEPSTYAALSGLLALGYVMVRRRK